jgi:hypothetical protein
MASVRSVQRNRRRKLDEESQVGHFDSDSVRRFAREPMVTRQCSATATTTGRRCRRAPIRGGTVCPKHGGAAPQVRRKAKQRLAEQEAQGFLSRQDIVPVANPYRALLELGGEALALKQYLSDRVAELRCLTATDRLGAENTAALLQAFERSLDRAHNVLRTIAKLDIETRYVQVEEWKARAFALAVKAGLDAAELSEAQRDRFVSVWSGEVERLIDDHDVLDVEALPA